MKTVLTDINVVPGVSGCFICDGDGRVLERALPHIYDDEMVAQAGHLTGWIADGLQSSGAMSEADLVFEQGRVAIRCLDGGYLCILCIPEVNVSLLNMTTNVAVRKLSEQMKHVPAPAAPEPEVPTRIRQLEALIRLELGSHSEKALDMLAGVADDPRELKKVCARIEKMTRLFVDKKKAREMSDAMAGILRG